MATYTYSTNAIEETALTLATADMNNQPSADPNNLSTNQSVLSILIKDDLASQAARFQNQTLISALVLYPSASADNKGVILAKLNLAYISVLPLDDQLTLLGSLGLPRFLNLSTEDRLSIFAALGLGV